MEFVQRWLVGFVRRASGVSAGTTKIWPPSYRRWVGSSPILVPLIEGSLALKVAFIFGASNVIYCSWHDIGCTKDKCNCWRQIRNPQLRRGGLVVARRMRDQWLRGIWNFRCIGEILFWEFFRNVLPSSNLQVSDAEDSRSLALYSRISRIAIE